MKRNGALVRHKYMEYLGSTLAFSLSIYLAAIVDGILVGQLIGPESFAAINYTMPMVYVKNIVFMLFINGGTTLAAQFLGERRHEDCNKMFTLSIFGCVAGYSLLILLPVLFGHPLATLLAGNGASHDAVLEYLFPLFVLGPFMAMSSGTAAFLRLDGRHKLATAVPVTANAINLGCDYIYIKFFHAGVAGAGWATVTGYFLSLFLLIPYFMDKRRNFYFSPVRLRDLKLFGSSFRIGLPMAMIQVCNFLKNITMNRTILAAFGDPGGEIISVCNNAMFYGVMMAEGSATAMSSVCSALFGEEDNNGILSVLKRAFVVTLGFCLVIFVLLELFPVRVGMLYGVNDPGTLSMLSRYLRIFALYVPLLAPLYVMRAFYQSTKHPDTATAISILEGAVITLPLFLLLSMVNKDLMWLSNCLSAALSLAVVILYMQKKAKSQGFRNFLMLKSDTSEDKYEFSTEASLSGAENASEETIRFLKDRGVEEKDYNAMGVAAEELCVNIARYAGLKEDAQIDIFLRRLEDGILLKIRDDGVLFNPTDFVGNTGERITGLSLVRAMGCTIEYDRILGFNTTIIRSREKTC